MEELTPKLDSIHIENLAKRYGTNQVLNGVNLKVDEGEFYALMGPNGSGKTTLASIIASVRIPDSGIVEIYGRKPEQAKDLIGYVPQDNFSSPKLTARENLMYFAKLLGYSGNEAKNLVTGMLERVGLSANADKRVAQYSGGMRKRLEVATALFPGVRILILDEPTTGLDPSARRGFFGLVEDIKDKETSIFLITHIGSDAELASRVGLIDRGRIIAEDAPQALKRTHVIEDVITVETAVKSDRVSSLLKGFSDDNKVLEIETGYKIYSRNGDKVLPEVIRTLDQAGHKVTRVELARPSLEDVFFKLTERTVLEVSG
jgi:ABC-2 type transport system ATP-binding protein